MFNYFSPEIIILGNNYNTTKFNFTYFLGISKESGTTNSN